MINVKKILSKCMGKGDIIPKCDEYKVLRKIDRRLGVRLGKKTEECHYCDKEHKTGREDEDED